MKRICFVTTTAKTLCSIVVPIADALYAQGDWDITFVCAPSADTKYFPVFVHFLPVPMKRGINLDGVLAVIKLALIFCREQYDLVQYSTPNAALYTSLASFLAHIRTRVYGQWGIRYVSFKGSRRKVFKLFEKLSCVLSTNLRPVSRKNLAFSVSEGLYPMSKAKVVGEGGTIGVDLSKYPLEQKQAWREVVRARYGIFDTNVVFGFMGRINTEKGCNELLTAFRALNNEKACLFIVGPVEESDPVDPDLLAWARKNPRIFFTGYVPHENIPMHYAAMDVYVHPTYREGFGMALQEAAAMALPIVTTDIPGASEVMEPDVSCILIPPYDADILATTLRRLCNDETIRDRLGKAARERVETYFERSLRLANLIRDYDSLICRRL